MACNNSIHTSSTKWDILEERIATFLKEGITNLEQVLGYHFNKPENAVIAFISKRAITEYTLRPNRTYLREPFLQEYRNKVECFSTLGDTIISSIVCGAHFLHTEVCTRHSMTQAKIKHTTNTRWEFLMRHHGFDKLIIHWPIGASIDSLLRLVMESLCAVILLDSANIAVAATVIGRLITPEDFPPERYESSRIEINRVFMDLGFKYKFRDAENTGEANMEFQVQELMVDNEVVGVGVAGTKESAQEAAAHEYMIGGGFANFCAIQRARKMETESVFKEKRHGDSSKVDYYTILARFFGVSHTILKKKVNMVPFTINDTDGKTSTSRYLCYITHDGQVIAAFVSDTKNDGVSGCLKRLFGYLSRGEECTQAH